jgi:hypothetical protein
MIAPVRNVEPWTSRYLVARSLRKAGLDIEPASIMLFESASNDRNRVSPRVQYGELNRSATFQHLNRYIAFVTTDFNIETCLS